LLTSRPRRASPRSERRGGQAGLSKHRKYEIIDHTADAGIRAYGSNMEEVFANSALGMMSLMVDAESVRPIERREIKAEGRDWESLLVSWLGEVLYQVEAEGRVFREFQIDRLSPFTVWGWGLGEALDPARHAFKVEIKAPTYHMLELKEDKGRWTAQVIFDV